jgi:hypothetical protein
VLAGTLGKAFFAEQGFFLKITDIFNRKKEKMLANVPIAG